MKSWYKILDIFCVFEVRALWKFLHTTKMRMRSNGMLINELWLNIAR